MFIVYVLQNSAGKLYKGYTNDLKKRLEQHNSNDGFSSYTKGRGPWKLVYKEEFKTRQEAIKREKYFKTGTGRDFLKRRLSASADG